MIPFIDPVYAINCPSLCKQSALALLSDPDALVVVPVCVHVHSLSPFLTLSVEVDDASELPAHMLSPSTASHVRWA